jgi:hypothetical protein
MIEGKDRHGAYLPNHNTIEHLPLEVSMRPKHLWSCRLHARTIPRTCQVTGEVMKPMERHMTPAKTMFLEIGRKRFQIASYEAASRMFCAARDKMGEGASRTPSPKIVDERGEVIAHVSYHGRVWAGATYVPDAVPLYDNRNAAEQARLDNNRAEV